MGDKGSPMRLTLINHACCKVEADGLGILFDPWTDGAAFNAEAVKYNFERMQDPKFPSARRSEVSPIQKVTVIDPTICWAMWKVHT